MIEAINIMNDKCIDFKNLTYDLDKDLFFIFSLFGQFGPILTAKELLRHDYFSQVDLQKLMLREYDLEKMLDIDCENLFIMHNKMDQWEDKFVFSDETKATFNRKNNEEFFAPIVELFKKI